VYGLAVDLDLSLDADYKLANLHIGPVALPDRDYADASYKWTIETMRWQTKRIIDRALSTSGPSTAPGTLTQATYTPSWELSKTHIVPG
jgi:hypothetical protein